MSKAMGRLGRVVGVLTQQWVGSLAGETYWVQEEGIWRETHCLRGQRHGRRGEASARGRCKRQKAKKAEMQRALQLNRGRGGKLLEVLVWW